MNIFLVPLAAKAAACLIYNNTNLYEQHLNQVQLNWNIKDFFLTFFNALIFSWMNITYNGVFGNIILLTADSDYSITAL